MLVAYEIHYWDEIDEKLDVTHGIVSGDTLGAAVDTVVGWYGKNNVEEINVYELEEVLDMAELKEMINDFEKDDDEKKG